MKIEKDMELSKTEYQVIGRIANGDSVKEIANGINRSFYTVDTHIKNAKKKNNLKNIADLTREFVLEFGNPKTLLI